ncbi:MAG: hypothetical protein DHS20C16_10250 [Phycisphaerae bacterium]|nr:MAG: hypothetical protein DHS20C16_10250 [Phycisphaerae bacterium]
MRKINLLMLLTVFALLSSGCDVQAPDGGNGGGDDGPPDMNTNGQNMNTNGEDVNTNGEGGADDVFAKIQDPDSDFETNEVRDVDGEIMQFDTETEELVWQLDGTRIANWRVNGTLLIFGNSTFQARFGTENGERRAFFTEVAPPTICDLVVNNGALNIFSTNTPVPQE